MSEREISDCCKNKDKDIASVCDNFHDTIEFIGKRWMGVIIYTLLKGPKRYHEILAEIPGISDRLLTERLRDLEHEGLVVKQTLESSSRKVQYELTPIGKELESVIIAIMKWINAHSNSRNEHK
jgi:DNA-binding HxlR family transcriptional regulator